MGITKILYSEEETKKILDTIEVLKKATSTEIEELTGISKERVKGILKKNTDKVGTIPRKGYVWIENKSKTEENPMKNSEGYSDPTCGKAILNTEKEDFDVNKYSQKVGDIWLRNNRPYTGYGKAKEAFSLILALSPGCASCLDVVLMDSFYDEKYCIIVNAKLPGVYYVDTRKVMQRSYGQFDRYRTAVTVEGLNYIRLKIGEFLKIPTESVVEKIVEVPVEKVVEVPVEKIVAKVEGNPVRKDGVFLSQAEYMEFKTKAEIWEKAFYAVCGKEA